MLALANVHGDAGADRRPLHRAVFHPGIDPQESVSIAERQRVEEHRLDDPEDGRIRANPERQRGDREQREQWRAHCRPNAEAEVMPQVVEPGAARLGEAVLREELRALGANGAKIAEAVERCGSCGSWIHPARNVLPDALLHVEADLIIHLSLRRLLERAPAAPW